jgi:hypothetical protein
MCNRLKKLDFFFSQNVNLTIEKNIYFKTASGAIATLFLLITVLSYASVGLIRVASSDIVSLSKEKRYLSPGNGDGFNPGIVGFDMMFGFARSDPDGRFGHWRVNYVNWG